MTDEKEKEVTSLVVEVAEKITLVGREVREKLVQTLLDREVASRVSLLDSAFQRRAKEITEMKKLDKPDVETFDKDGKPFSVFSKERNGQRNKAREKLQKLESAIEKAMGEKPDFKKLREMLGQK